MILLKQLPLIVLICILMISCSEESTDSSSDTTTSTPRLDIIYISTELVGGAVVFSVRGEDEDPVS